MKIKLPPELLPAGLCLGVDMKNQYDHNATHISLREYLIPVEQWREDFTNLELSDMFEHELPPLPEHMIRHPHYIMPYPYVLPVWLELMRTAGKPVSPNDIHGIWELALADRYTKCLRNAISEDAVSAIDDTYGLGALVLRLTGQIVPFDYSEITGVQFEILSAQAACLIAELAQANDCDGDTEEVKALCEILDDMEDRYDLHYSLMYGDHVTREITESEIIPSSFPGKVFLDMEDIGILGVYVNQMLSMRAKVIPLI